MTRSRQSPSGRALARFVPALTRKAFGDRGFHQAAVLTDWPEIVGEELAGKCVAIELGRDGALTVRADGPTAVALQHIEPQILDRIATYFGFRAVKRLVIRQGPVEMSEKPTAAPQTDAPTPSAALESTLADMSDPALKDALLKLGAQVEDKWDDP